MIKISDVPLAMQYMSGNKIGKFICLRKMSSLESFHGCYLHETYSHNSHCKCTEICLELLEKLPLKRRQIADLFLRVGYASLLPLKKFSPSSKDYLVSS